MPDTLAWTGPWTLTPDGDRLQALADRLTNHLQTYSMVHTEFDGFSPQSGLKTGFAHLAREVHVKTELGQPWLCVPVGLGMKLPARPLEFNGQLHHAQVDLVGDTVTLQWPYTLGEPRGLYWQYHSLVRLRRR